LTSRSRCSKTSQEAEHWQALKCNLLLDQETFSRGIIYYKNQKSSRTTFELLPIKNFDALDKSSTQFDLGTNFF
jgi:hypothetical protein